MASLTGRLLVDEAVSRNLKTEAELKPESNNQAGRLKRWKSVSAGEADWWDLSLSGVGG